MIADKQVIERLGQYMGVFYPKLSAIAFELSGQGLKPSVDSIEKMLELDDAEIALLDFLDLVHSVQSAKRKLAKPKP
jgi:hypothetical protein